MTKQELIGKNQIKAALEEAGLDEEEMLGNNAEPIKEYPDYDYDDKDLFLDKHQGGY